MLKKLKMEGEGIESSPLRISTPATKTTTKKPKENVKTKEVKKQKAEEEKVRMSYFLCLMILDKRNLCFWLEVTFVMVKTLSPKFVISECSRYIIIIIFLQRNFECSREITFHVSFLQFHVGS